MSVVIRGASVRFTQQVTHPLSEETLFLGFGLPQLLLDFDKI